MEDFQKRMCGEHDELVDRLSKLNAALKKDGFKAESWNCPVYSYD